MWLETLSNMSSNYWESMNVSGHTAETSGYRERGGVRHTLQPPPRNTPRYCEIQRIETNGQSNTAHEG